MQHIAPVVLFVYNRPAHTQATLRHLAGNKLAEEARLFIYSDGPKNHADVPAVEEVRQICRQATGFKAVSVIESKVNMGLAQAVINGVTQTLQQYQTVIVFEDDLISSPFTLMYFNEALEIYRNQQQVMHIGAYMYPLPANTLPETFFYRAATSWGWATWRRAWQYFNPDIDALMAAFTPQLKRDFALNNSMNYWKQMVEFKKGKNNSWAIRWYASIFLNKGLCLNPAKSLITNIGHDGTGIHSGVTNVYTVAINTTKPISYYPHEIKENADAVRLISEFLKGRKGSFFTRVRNYIRTHILK